MATTSLTTTNKIKDIVNPDVILILKSVLDQCEKEKNEQNLVVHISDVLSRASCYTGFPTYVFLELQERDKNFTPINISISQKVSFLKNFKEIYNLAIHKVKSHNFSQLITWIYEKTAIFPNNNPYSITQQLCALKYEIKNTNIGPMYIENAKLRYERFLYLSKIIKFRNENRPICYIEVRVLDLTLKFDKFTSPMQSMETYYFLYAITRSSYISGLFCNVINREIFSKWITDILITKLLPNSVIVLDSGELFDEEHTPITRYSSKKDMLQWLRMNDVPCTSEMYKPELYELISKSGIKSCTYKIDQILRAHGYNVLRKPENFNDLSPTELLWYHLKMEGYEKGIKMANLKLQIEENIKKVETLKWELYTDTIANREKEIFELDCDIDTLLDSLNYVKNSAVNNFD